MSKRDVSRVDDMLYAAQKAVSLARGNIRVDLDKNEVLALALVRLMEIVGGSYCYLRHTDC